jgi:DNA polymerase III delta subunit
VKVEAWGLDLFHVLDKASHRGLVCYGTDKELKEYLFQTLAAQGDALFVGEKEFLQNPLGFGRPDLFSAFSPTQRRACVVIEDVQDRNAPLYERFLTAADPGPDPEAPFLLLYGASLRSTSKLVLAFQKQRDLIATPCYSLTPEQHATLLRGALQAEPILSIPKDWVSVLARALSLSAFRDFVTKLVLAYGDGPVQPTCPEDCLIFMQTETDFGEFAFILSEKNPEKLTHLLGSASFDFSEVLLRIRQSVYHFLALLQVRGLLQQGESLEKAMGQVSPPVFFKHRPLFQEHLKKWSISQLYEALALLAESELSLKKTNIPSVSLHLISKIPFISS